MAAGNSYRKVSVANSCHLKHGKMLKSQAVQKVALLHQEGTPHHHNVQ